MLLLCSDDLCWVPDWYGRGLGRELCASRCVRERTIVCRDGATDTIGSAAIPLTRTFTVGELPVADWANSGPGGPGQPQVITTTAASGTMDVYLRGTAYAENVYFTTYQDVNNQLWYAAAPFSGGVWKATINLGSHPGFAPIHLDVWEFQNNWQSLGPHGLMTTYRYQPGLAAANSSFEAGAGGTPTGWWDWQVSSSGSAAASRTGALGLAQPTPSAGAGITGQDIVGALPGKKYHVTAWVRAASAGSGASAWMHLSDGVTWSSGGDTTPIVPTTTWQPLSLDFTATNEATIRIHLIRDTGAGTIYWGDVQITPDLTNNGFEGGAAGWSKFWFGTLPTIDVSSVRLTGAGGIVTDGGAGGYFQDLRGLETGRTYRVSAWVKGTAGNSASAQLWLHNNLDSNLLPSQVVEVKSNINTTADWQRIYADFTPANSGNMRVHLFRPSATAIGPIYWDDVTVGDPN